MSLAALRKDLEGGLRPLYVVVGPRPMVDRARSLLEAVASPKGSRGARIDRVRVGDDPNPARALELVRELSLFAPRKVVELHGLEEAKAELCHAVLAYLESPVVASTLIVTGTTLPRAAPQGKVQRAMGRSGLWLDLRDTHPGGFAIAVARAQGKDLSPELAQRIVDTVGGDLGVVEQEVIKLSTYAGDGPIDGEAVDAVCPALAEPVVWQLSEGLTRVDPDAVLDVAQRLGQDIGGAIQLTGVAGSALRRQLQANDRLDAAAGLRRFANVTRQARDGGDAVNALHGYLLERLTPGR